MGHIPGPLVFPIGTGDDPAAGLSFGNSGARLSTGYGDARHLPTVLVENHSLKPYEQRVLGTYVLLATVLETAGRDTEALRRAVTEDQRRRIDAIPLAWDPAERGKPAASLDFLGIESRVVLSPISGTVRREWLGRPVTMKVPIYSDTSVSASAPRPKAYWIPAQWHDIADRVRAHGIAMERITEPRQLRVEMYRLIDPKLAQQPFEGRVVIETLGVKPEVRTERFPAGSWRVSADQALGTLAAILLEPASPDSFLQWGFFHSILQRTEYAEAYALERLAQRMLAADPKLAEEFQRKLMTDSAFRASATERLRWFYQQTPFWDDRWLLYPVARER